MNSIHFQSSGNHKKIILYFPGWQHPLIKEPVFAALLKNHFNVISVKIPGYDKTRDSNNYKDFTEIVSDLNNELAKQQINPAAFVGFSMGCQLILKYLDTYPSKTKCIFIGCPTNKHDVPLWAQILFKSRFVLNILRKPEWFMRYAVNRALRDVTGDNSAQFTQNEVTLKGAFDSLIGLLHAEISSINFPKNTVFIYGKNDRYLTEAQEKGVAPLRVIANAEHNCMRDHENEVCDLIMSAM